MKKIIGIISICLIVLAVSFTSFAELRWDDDNGGIKAEWDDTNSKVTLQLYKGSSYKVGGRVRMAKGKTSHDFTELIRNTGPGSYRYSLTGERGTEQFSDYYQVGEDTVDNLNTDQWFFENGVWLLKNYKGVTLTGWKFHNEKWYYLDPQTGACWMNIYTPDGYFVDATGAWDGNPAKK